MSEQYKAAQKQYQIDHKEEISAKRKLYRLANKEKIAASGKAWRESHREHRAEQHQSWAIVHREQLNAQARERRKPARLAWEALKAAGNLPNPWDEKDVGGEIPNDS